MNPHLTFRGDIGSNIAHNDTPCRIMLSEALGKNFDPLNEAPK
jgi:hypothetical protein